MTMKYAEVLVLGGCDRDGAELLALAIGAVWQAIQSLGDEDREAFHATIGEDSLSEVLRAFHEIEMGG